MPFPIAKAGLVVAAMDHATNARAALLPQGLRLDEFTVTTVEDNDTIRLSWRNDETPAGGEWLVSL